jgi:Tle cognate immunity protein 4 C-terminal domain/Tle cognate immunity protein 4 N-terminal domain
MRAKFLAVWRTCFAWGTWGQRVRTVTLSIVLALVGFWAYGVLSVHFYRPKPMITLSGKTQTQCVGRYLMDVPVELGLLGSNDTQLLYGLDENFKKVEMDVKDPDYTRTQFEKEVQARVDDIKGERTDWGSPTLLAQEVIETQYGKGLMLRFLNRGTVSARIQSELHMLVGSRYTLLKSNSYDIPDPEPKATKEKPMYTYIDPKPAEDRLRAVAMNIQGYTDATKAPQGFCVAGVVLNNKTMGYDIETAFFHSNVDSEQLPHVNLTINMQGQYAGHSEEYENLFQRVNSQSAGLRVALAAEGGQLVVLRHKTPQINSMPGREYGHAMHTIGGKVIFQLFAETALAKEQQSMLRPFFNFDFEAGSSMEEKTSPLDEEQVLKIWDGLLGTMRLSPANGGNRIDAQTGGLVPTVKVGQTCPRTGWWEPSLPGSHPAAPYLASSAQRFKMVTAGQPMPHVYAKFMFADTADADNAAITWTFVKEA